MRRAGLHKGENPPASLFLPPDSLVPVIDQTQPEASLHGGPEDGAQKGQPQSQEKDRDGQIWGPMSKPSTFG